MEHCPLWQCNQPQENSSIPIRCGTTPYLPVVPWPNNTPASTIAPRNKEILTRIGIDQGKKSLNKTQPPSANTPHWIRRHTNLHHDIINHQSQTPPHTHATTTTAPAFNPSPRVPPSRHHPAAVANATNARQVLTLGEVRCCKKMRFLEDTDDGSGSAAVAHIVSSSMCGRHVVRLLRVELRLSWGLRLRFELWRRVRSVNNYRIVR